MLGQAFSQEINQNTAVILNLPSHESVPLIHVRVHGVMDLKAVMDLHRTIFPKPGENSPYSLLRCRRRRGIRPGARCALPAFTQCELQVVQCALCTKIRRALSFNRLLPNPLIMVVTVLSNTWPL